MPRTSWNGSRVTKALRWLYVRDNGTCWLCPPHPVQWHAKSIDHILPVATHPELEWDPNNWRLAHIEAAGTPKGCQYPGCQCPGNKGRKDKPWTLPPTRHW